MGDITCLRQKFVDEDEGERDGCAGDEKKRFGVELIDSKWGGKADELIREKLWEHRWALPLGAGDERRVRVVEMVKFRWGKVVDETGVEVSDAEEGSHEYVPQMVP